MPYSLVVADFQQLQPVSGGGLCQQFCELMLHIELDTVYRTSDPAHLLFQNCTREAQVEREDLEEYFEGRHWNK